MGFEPTVAKGYTRSPGVPDRPLQHLSAVCGKSNYMPKLLTFDWYTGGEGGIRTHAPLNVETAFRERHHKPLGHLSLATAILYHLFFGYREKQKRSPTRMPGRALLLIQLILSTRQAKGIIQINSARIKQIISVINTKGTV